MRIAIVVLAVFLGTVFLAAPDVALSGDVLEYAILIHGGAGGSLPSDEDGRARRKVLTDALSLGKKILNKGGTSLDTVEQVIRRLENAAEFNAGRGAVFNHAASHELDASIMDGRNHACGAVAGVMRVKNPISLARLVMTKTRHVLLASNGADKFAEEMGVELVENNYFSTPSKRAALERAQRTERERKQKHMGTVGCVVLDRHGNLAAGTSTGGLTNKRFGRVGDSPIIGAGTYADNSTCAVSCTGVGEHFIRYAIAYDVSARMKYQGVSVSEAVRAVVHDRLKPGQGGVIAVSKDGSLSVDFNTVGMSRAMADSNGRFEVHVGR